MSFPVQKIRVKRRMRLAHPPSSSPNLGRPLRLVPESDFGAQPCSAACQQSSANGLLQGGSEGRRSVFPRGASIGRATLVRNGPLKPGDRLSA
jgi:hypothetical protein